MRPRGDHQYSMLDLIAFKFRAEVAHESHRACNIAKMTRALPSISSLTSEHILASSKPKSQQFTYEFES